MIVITHKDKAIEYFNRKFHCSQAVLAAFADECGLTEMQPDGSEKESYRVPIYSDTYNEICDKLNEFDDNEVYGIGNDSITYRGFMDEKYIDDELLSVPGFVILLMFIGFTSVISTMIINIRIRSREFAVLKSVGMTGKSLRKMVYCESLFCLLKAILPGTLFGLLIPLGVNLAIRQAFPILFHIPWGNIFFGIILIQIQ